MFVYIRSKVESTNFDILVSPSSTHHLLERQRNALEVLSEKLLCPQIINMVFEMVMITRGKVIVSTHVTAIFAMYFHMKFLNFDN